MKCYIMECFFTYATCNQNFSVWMQYLQEYPINSHLFFHSLCYNVADLILYVVIVCLLLWSRRPLQHACLLYLNLLTGRNGWAQILHFWTPRQEKTILRFPLLQVSLKLLDSNLRKVALCEHFHVLAALYLLLVQLNILIIRHDGTLM